MSNLKNDRERGPIIWYLDTVRVFIWLCCSSIFTQLSVLIINYSLKNGEEKSLGTLIDRWSQHTVDSELDSYEHNIMLGPIRLLTITIVTNPNLFAEFYRINWRSQFDLASVLVDMKGKGSFIHQPLYIREFMQDKNFFKTTLRQQHEVLAQTIKRHFESDVRNHELWERYSVMTLMQRLVFKSLSETYLGLSADQIMSKFSELVPLIERFDRLWQNPALMRPLTMIQLLLRLTAISDELHNCRKEAPLLDQYMTRHGRRMNIAAIFFVSANLTKALAHAIIKVGTNSLQHSDCIEHTQAPELLVKDYTALVLTDRFRDSRVFRISPNVLLTPQSHDPNRKMILNYSSVKNMTFNGVPVKARQMILLPTGLLHRRRIESNNIISENRRVRPHYVFAEGRSCPGGPSVEVFVRTILLSIWANKRHFEVGATELGQYDAAIAKCHITGSNGRAGAIPEVYGFWGKTVDNTAEQPIATYPLHNH